LEQFYGTVTDREGIKAPDLQSSLHQRSYLTTIPPRANTSIVWSLWFHPPHPPWFRLEVVRLYWGKDGGKGSLRRSQPKKREEMRGAGLFKTPPGTNFGW